MLRMFNIDQAAGTGKLAVLDRKGETDGMLRMLGMLSLSDTLSGCFEYVQNPFTW